MPSPVELTLIQGSNTSNLTTYQKLMWGYLFFFCKDNFSLLLLGSNVLGFLMISGSSVFLLRFLNNNNNNNKKGYILGSDPAWICLFYHLLLFFISVCEQNPEIFILNLRPQLTPISILANWLFQKNIETLELETYRTHTQAVSHLAANPSNCVFKNNVATDLNKKYLTPLSLNFRENTFSATDDVS